jgi:UDP-N-acetyl-D-mannosaminuronate dehydrogenase
MYGLETYTPKNFIDHVKLLPYGRDLNDFMPEHMVELMENALKEAGKHDNLKISLMGVAYKADCDDTRNTPTERIVNFLKNRYHSHNIEYIAHDPWVREKDYTETDLTEDFNIAVDNSDVLLFATNHKQYYSIDLDDLKKKMSTNPIIIDGRNIFDKQIIEAKGFIYRKIGEGSK